MTPLLYRELSIRTKRSCRYGAAFHRRFPVSCSPPNPRAGTDGISLSHSFNLRRIEREASIRREPFSIVQDTSVFSPLMISSDKLYYSLKQRIVFVSACRRYSRLCRATVHWVLMLISTWDPDPTPASLSQEVLKLRFSTRDRYMWDNSIVIRLFILLQYPGSNAGPGFLRRCPSPASCPPQRLLWKTSNAL